MGAGDLGDRASAAAAGAIDGAKQQAGRLAREAPPWVEKLARLGYAARGVVYVTVGWLALLAALGWGGKKTTADGALATIARQPFGKLLLVALTLGLFGYALWRIVEGITDPERKGSDAKGLAKRIGYVASGITYSALALTAVGILRGTGGPRDGATQDATARLMAQPLGQWLVGAVGLGILLIGINAAYIAITEKFRKKLKLVEMSPAKEEWAMRVGKAGMIARGVIYGIIGIFLIQAAFADNPDKARGLDGALQALALQPFGKLLLGSIAVGLIALGVYSFFEARYRRIMDN